MLHQSLVNNLSISSMTVNIGFFDEMVASSLTTHSASISNLTVINSLSGVSGFFNNLTGGNIYASTQISSPLITGNSHSGVSGFFTSITGTNNISDTILSGSSHTVFQDSLVLLQVQTFMLLLRFLLQHHILLQ